MWINDNSMLGIIFDGACECMFSWIDKILRKIRKKPKGHAITIEPAPETDPDHFYRVWLEGARMAPSGLPTTRLTIKSSPKSVDELAKQVLGNENLYVCHTGHEENECPGEPLSEGLREIFSGQPSSWVIESVRLHGLEFGLPLERCALCFFLVQEFEGNKPGDPNRDFCRMIFDRKFGPMELELMIPHYVTREGFLAVIYLKVVFTLDPEKGLAIIGHQDNMDLQP